MQNVFGTKICRGKLNSVYIVTVLSLIWYKIKFQVERIETERMQQHLIATRRMVEQLRLEEHLPEENGSGDGNIDQEIDDGRKLERPKAKLDSTSLQIGVCNIN